MRLSGTFKSLLLLGVAAGAAACSNADIASPGAGNPITPVIVPPGGGGGSLSQNLVPPSGCSAGTTQTTRSNFPGSTATFAVCLLDNAAAAAGPVTISQAPQYPILIENTAFVGADGGAAGNLTIGAGTVLFGNGADGVDLIVVTRGSQINATGTAASPIVMTSAEDLTDDGQPNATAGSGQWGGVAINGFAPINDCTVDPLAVPGSANCEKDGEGGSGLFGGDQPNDNSGTLRYVRIQHAGFQFSSTNELNGLALQGVGDGTTIEFLQVHNNADDGIEFFGGTVNVRNVVLTGNDDDSFDWTDGWTGHAQFVLAAQTTGRGDNGIEGDNRGSDPLLTPRSNPQISNMTLIGRNNGSGNEGVQVRAGTNGRFVNFVVAGFGSGVEYDPEVGLSDPVLQSFAVGGNTSTGDADGIALLGADATNQVFAADTLNGVIPGINENSVTPTDPTTLGGFFIAANYAGAFSASETNSSNWTSGWTVHVPGAQAAGCPAGTTATGEAVPAGRTEAQICRINRPVTGAVSLTIGNLYEVEGSTFVGTDLGPDPAAPLASGVAASLTVDPGVTIFAEGSTTSDPLPGAGDTGLDDVLVVTRGSQLFVNGSAVAPVVMTSREEVFGGTGATGDWGGLVINGRAPINDCTVDPLATPGSVNCEKDGEGGSGRFGGATPGDNSGRINYLRIENSGRQFSSTNELNGIAVQGVGSGTIIDYLQIYRTADDGLEFFGGTVDAKHVIVTGQDDDGLDWTDGWVGRLQFAIVNKLTGGDNGVEGDNRSSNPLLTPRSNPIWSNVTLVGNGSGEGFQVRAGTDGTFANVIVTGFAEGIDYTLTAGLSDPSVDSFALTANAAQLTNDAPTIFAAGSNNITNATSTLTTRPGATLALVPGANETTPAVDPTTLDATFFDPASYVGAVNGASDDWYLGWTRGL
ncbi:MAG: hypothetical protein ACOZAA_04400 [Pseudomonadota bacterium]